MGIKRSKYMTFVNTTPGAAATYVLEGKGVDSMSIDMAPKMESYVDITADTGTSDLIGYEPKSGISKRVDASDALFTYIHGLYKNRAIGADAVTDIVNVFAWETATAGAYPAEKQSVTVSINSVGGDGGGNVVYEYEYAYRGDATKGTFNPTTKAFVAA